MLTSWDRSGNLLCLQPPTRKRLVEYRWVPRASKRSPLLILVEWFWPDEAQRKTQTADRKSQRHRSRSKAQLIGDGQVSPRNPRHFLSIDINPKPRHKLRGGFMEEKDGPPSHPCIRPPKQSLTSFSRNGRRLYSQLGSSLIAPIRQHAALAMEEP